MPGTGSDGPAQTVYGFVSKTTETYTPAREGISHGGGDDGISVASVDPVKERDQSLFRCDTI